MVKDLREEFPSLIDRAYKEYMKQFRLVENIMSKDVTTISPHDSMAEAVKEMGEKHIGSLIVMVSGKPAAIVTERDLLSKVLAQGKDPKTVTIGEVMSTPLITINPKATIKEAAQTMIKKKGRLVVFDDRKLVGIVTAADLIRSLPEIPETMLTVDEIMTKDVVTCEDEATVENVAKLMGSERIGSVIVNRRKKPFSIFTERDLLTSFLARGESLDTKVGNAASSPLITIPSGTSVHSAAYTMVLKHVRRLPVVKDEKIVGIVTARDLVEAYAK
ncbi:MAG: CBS domain-containing protein [Candidatus Bathyarchaeota archaeon]